MKSVKGRILKKLKTIKTIGYPKPERILHVNAADGLIDKLETRVSEEEIMQIERKIETKSSFSVQEVEIIDVSELMKGLEESDESDIDNKENSQPVRDPIADRVQVHSNSKSLGASGSPLLEIDILRAPNLDSGTVFDPNLLSAYQQGGLEVKARGLGYDHDSDTEPPLKSLKLEDVDNPLLDFERICPPGGSDSVILYTTGFRSIRKTFEDCASVRILLEGFKVLYDERDLSMHMDFGDELWRLLGGKVVPPRLFIKGRYIGGAEEVLRLHEQGRLRPLLAGIPVNTWDGPCEGCAGVRFVVCFRCSGSRKVGSGDGRLPEKCGECNENGLILCPFCC
ncbi:uncharacterized protein At3g28850-like [Bidens hawaiensis]|uniref:uncharacterized protein At3g28850-like n=1 Tax=Bidens hawaiensis TaxID=980011 RepID=UPI00404AAB0D